jgi:hypothetical protein
MTTTPDTLNQDPAARLTRLLGTVPGVVLALELPVGRTTVRSDPHRGD